MRDIGGFFVLRDIGDNEATTTADEYMPRWVSEKPKEHAPSVWNFQGRGVITVNKFSSQDKAVIDAKEKSIVQINTIYYRDGALSWMVNRFL
jgi:hypothetical protein